MQLQDSHSNWVSWSIAWASFTEVNVNNEMLSANCWRQRKKPRTQGLVLRVRLKKIKTFKHFNMFKKRSRQEASRLICHLFTVEWIPALFGVRTDTRRRHFSRLWHCNGKFEVYCIFIHFLDNKFCCVLLRIESFWKKAAWRTIFAAAKRKCIDHSLLLCLLDRFCNFPLALNWSSFTVEKPKLWKVSLCNCYCSILLHIRFF